jgi:hypothetical protein
MSFTGSKDLVSKADKVGQAFKRAFVEYTSRLYILKLKTMEK